ncbi:MAG: TetR/AcrR family transcriptional regulator [Bdellovibrionales bacterium]|nr:TetR/AcrR family transcriptional regulator [Bdellovibrionales bacterium]
MPTNKEERILKATIHCIGKYGIERTNAQTVADHLGVAQSGIFYYFPKQRMLFDSLIHYIVKVNHQIVTLHLEKVKPQSGMEELMEHLRGNLLWAKKHPDQVGVLLLSMVRARSSAPMRQLLNQILQTGQTRIFHCLQTALDAGEATTQDSATTVAAAIHKALTGVIVSYYYARSQTPELDYYFGLLQLCVSGLVVSRVGLPEA